MTIPVEVDEVTADWLTEVLQGHAPGAVVDAVEVLDTSSGTTGRARLGLSSADDRIPDSVFVKLPPFTADRRAMVNMVGMGVAEARFYEAVASWLPVRTPPVWHAAHDLSDDGYIMVFEDLTVAGATQPTQEEADAADFAALVMEQMASFHAHMHASPRLSPGGDLHWIAERTHGYGSDEGMAIMRMGIHDFGDRMPPVFHEIAELYLTRGVDFNEVLFEGPQTLVHGDSHIGNMLRTPDGPVLLDWAMVSRGPGLRDVAYFIGNSVPTDVRHRHEQDLLRTYLDALGGHGVEIGWDEAWDTYRLQMVTGWIAAASTAALGDTLQPLEIGMRATERSNVALEELEVVDEPVAVDPGFRGRRVRLPAAVVEEVLDGLVVEQHQVVGEQAAVAAPPHRLRAHQADVALGGPFEQRGDPVPELGALHVVGVGAELLVAKADVRRGRVRGAAPSERREPRVGDPVVGEPSRHGLGPEVREPAAARVAPHVDDLGDPGRADDRDEALGVEGAVTEGADRHDPSLQGPGADANDFARAGKLGSLSWFQTCARSSIG